MPTLPALARGWFGLATIAVVVVGLCWIYDSRRAPLPEPTYPSEIAGRWRSSDDRELVLDLRLHGPTRGHLISLRPNSDVPKDWFDLIWEVREGKLCFVPQSEDDDPEPACSDYNVSGNALIIRQDIEFPPMFKVPAGTYKKVPDGESIEFPKK
ncbi:MAG: hypothetical protein P4L46_13215 [Fimbriimonas sp.]|nr:hypothetical protein [Fimbriimonas sp.]